MQKPREGLIHKAKSELDELIMELQLQRKALDRGTVDRAPTLRFAQYHEAVTNILFFERVSDFFTLTPKHEGNN